MDFQTTRWFHEPPPRAVKSRVVVDHDALPRVVIDGNSSGAPCPEGLICGAQTSESVPPGYDRCEYPCEEGLQTRRAVKLYERFGFQFVSRTDTHYHMEFVHAAKALKGRARGIL